MKNLLMMAGATLACGAVAFAQPKPNVAKAAKMAPPPMKTANVAPLASAIGANFDRLFVIHNTMGNLNEVTLGQLALSRSRNAGVRAVAKMTMAEHGAAQRDLAAAARSQGYPLPPDPGPVNKAFARHLAGLRGAAFDREYMAAQVAGHEATITLVQHEIEHGKNPRVKAYAQNKLPGILGHTAMIYTVAAQVGAPGTNLRPAAIKQAAAQAAMEKMDGMKMGKMKMGKM